MNKTFSIALAGFSFTIEEHAYIKLNDYIKALRSTLNTEEADEVMHDIEIRMVEIFRDTLGKKEVLNDADVEKVIAQIGTPEKIEAQENEYFSESKKNTNLSSRELFRDPERAKIAGVCSGLSYYTGLDLNAMRAIWLGMFILGIVTQGISSSLVFLLYIVLWIVLPKATTATDLLKMKGKPMNFDNLKSESNKIVQFANESTQKVGEFYQESKPIISKTSNGIWNVIRYALGALFILFAIGGLISIFAIFGFIGTSSMEPVNQMSFYFDDGYMIYVMTAIIILATLIPTLFFALMAIKLLSPKTQLKNIGWVIGGLFLVLLFLGAYLGVNMAQKNIFMKGDKVDKEEIALNTTSDTLYINYKQIEIPQQYKAYDDDIFSDKKMVFHEDFVDLEITRKADVKSPYLVITKEGKGYNIPLKLTVPLEIKDNQIYFPNFIKYPYEHRFRDYEVYYELVIPSTTKIISNDKNNIYISGDTNGNGLNDDEEENENYGISKEKTNSISIRENKVIINGTSIEYSSSDENNVRINGKKYPKNQAKKILDSMKVDFDLNSINNLELNLEDDNIDLSIKGNK